jgi:hypothetical protein
MVTIADVESLFKKHHWNYQMTQGGNLVSGFDGITVGVGVNSSAQVIVIFAPVFIAEGAAAASLQANAGDVDSFLMTFASRISSSEEFTIERDAQSVYVHSTIHVRGTLLDEGQFVRALTFTVAAASVLSPFVRALALGQTTLRQALDLLNRVIEEVERERRRRSA